MPTYIFKKFFLLLFTMWFVVTLIFFVLRSVPGGPAYTALGPYATREAVKELERKWGLDKPIMTQYSSFLRKLFRGDLGESYISGIPISRQIRETLPYTLDLTFAGMLIGIIFGVPLGLLTAVKRNSTIDYGGRVFSLCGLSFPEFFLGVLLIFLFSVKWKIFPAMGGGDLDNLGSRLLNIVLPGCTLGMVMISFISRMTRSSVLNVLQENYIRAARAKGLTEFLVIFKHALRNASIPITTVVGIYFSILMGGAIMTEVVFTRPGLGKLMIFALKDRDYMLLQSSLIVFTGFVFVINALTDVLYAFIDPRIRR